MTEKFSQISKLYAKHELRCASLNRKIECVYETSLQICSHNIMYVVLLYINT